MIDISAQVIKVFPKLTQQTKKGDSGNIGVIGGSYEYTGAPFYAALTSLKVGGDLAHIFCSKSAANSIKTYSPQLIVHPLFCSENQYYYTEEELQKVHQKWVQELQKYFERIKVWVIGPGLGRDKYMHSFFPKLVERIPQNKIVLFDADGLYFLCQHPGLLKKLSTLKAILSPNHRQFQHLNKILQIDCSKLPNTQDLEQNSLVKIQNKMDHKLPAIIVKKGKVDTIITNQWVYLVSTKGGLKRCGGIGDILAGSIAVCAFWSLQKGIVLGCHITKVATKIAYEKQGRCLTAPEIMKFIPAAVHKIQQYH